MSKASATARFTADNTEGYSAADLAVLNDRFVAVCAAEGLDLDDPNKYDFEQHLASDLLAEFDGQQED